MLLKRTSIPYSRKKENLFMYVMRDIAHRGWINSPEYCSPQAFLDCTMSCDVTGILAENALLSRALYQTLRGQRVKRERLGTRLPNIKNRVQLVTRHFLTSEKARLCLCVYLNPNQNIAPVIKNFHNSGRSRTEPVIVSRLSGIFSWSTHNFFKWTAYRKPYWKCLVKYSGHFVAYFFF